MIAQDLLSFSKGFLACSLIPVFLLDSLPQTFFILTNVQRLSALGRIGTFTASQTLDSIRIQFEPTLPLDAIDLRNLERTAI